MLDMTLNDAAQRAWQDSLQRADVALFRFPHAEPDAAPEAPKSRPCLVLEVERRHGHIFAELAYGTSENTTANRAPRSRSIGRKRSLPRVSIGRPASSARGVSRSAWITADST